MNPFIADLHSVYAILNEIPEDYASGGLNITAMRMGIKWQATEMTDAVNFIRRHFHVLSGMFTDGTSPEKFNNWARIQFEKERN